MVRVPIQSFAQFRDRLVAMAHDVVVDLLALQTLRRFHVDGRHAQTAVQVAFVGFQRR
jgi:hypothetical protein